MLTPASAPGPPVSKLIGCAVWWAITSSPGLVCTRSAISLHIVPDGRNTAASFPRSSATISQSWLTVGSSSFCSSPTSASHMKRRMSAVGRVTVSLARSTSMRMAGIRSRLPAERLRRLGDRLLRRHSEILEHWRKRHRHVHGPDALDRRVEVIERALRDDRRDLGDDAIALVALVHHHSPRGLLRGLDQRLLVERPGRARVHHLGAAPGSRV